MKKFKQIHFDLAKSVQSKYEEILIEVIKNLKVIMKIYV